MNTYLNNVSVWSAILSLQRAIENLSDDMESDCSMALSDWGKVIEDRLQNTVNRCVSDGISEEAVSDAIDAGMPPLLAHLRHRLY